MLEGACMKEEPIPPMMNQEGMMGGQAVPQQIIGMTGPHGVGAPVANMGAMQQQMQAMASRGMQQPMPMREGRIDEMHEGL